jgi:hypothetical protein
MKNAGFSPEQIYAQARDDNAEVVSYLHLIRTIFDVSLAEGRGIIERGEKLYFQDYILPSYMKMKNEGKSPEALYRATENDKRLDYLDPFRVVMSVFEMSVAETKRVIGEVY